MTRYHYENLALSSACESVLDVGNAGNLYIDERAPWSCFKKGGETAEMAAKVKCTNAGIHATLESLSHMHL
jgi:methionyl-tRNA synthetase